MMPEHEHIGLLIAATRRRIRQKVVGIAARFGLSAQQFWIIVGVSEREGSALVEVASRHRIDQPTASRVVATLTEKRLLRVAADPRDRRRSRLRLTPAGKALAKELVPLAADVRGVINGCLSDGERTVVAASLRKIMAAIDRSVEERPEVGRARVFPSADD
jgi:DNA-binding MarR family transcriptional regulator